MDKVVLAYSGGLDTSVCLKWLQEERHLQVITFSAEIGQGLNFEELRSKALSSGASKVYIEDLREEFLMEYAFPTMAAGAIYERQYLLGTSFYQLLEKRQIIRMSLAIVHRYSTLYAKLRKVYIYRYVIITDMLHL